MRTTDPGLKESFVRTANTFRYCYEQALRRLLTIHLPTFLKEAGNEEAAALSGSIVSMGRLDFEGCGMLAQHIGSAKSQLEYDVLRSSFRVLMDYAALMKWGQLYCDTKTLSDGLRVMMEMACIAAFKKAGGKECWCGCEYDSPAKGEQMEAILAAAFLEEQTCQMTDMADGTRDMAPGDLDPDMPDLRKVERTIGLKKRDTRRGAGRGMPRDIASLLQALQGAGAEVVTLPMEVSEEVFGEKPKDG
jgi:hypothetical protein